MEELTVVTIQEAFDRLGIDYVDDVVTSNVKRAIRLADSYLKSAVGKDYPADDPKAKELALMLVDDVYNNRGMLSAGATNHNVRRLFDELAMQLRLELIRRQKEDVKSL